MILAHSTLFLPYTQIIWFFREEHVFWLHFNLQEEFLNVFIEMQEKRAQQIQLEERLAHSAGIVEIIYCSNLSRGSISWFLQV